MTGGGGAAGSRLTTPITFKDVKIPVSDVEEMKNKAEEAAQQAQQAQQGEGQDQGQQDQQGQSMKDKAMGKAMDEGKKRMDANGDGKFDGDDVKKMGEDAVNKVKGLFKKD